MKRVLCIALLLTGCAAELGGKPQSVGGQALALEQVAYGEVSEAPPCAQDLHEGMLLRETVPYNLIAVFESGSTLCLDSWEKIESLLANRWAVNTNGLIEPTPEPDVRVGPADTFKPNPKPDVEPTPEPDVEPTPEPDVEPTPEPDVEPTPEPDVDPMPTPPANG